VLAVVLNDYPANARDGLDRLDELGDADGVGKLNVERGDNVFLVVVHPLLVLHVGHLGAKLLQGLGDSRNVVSVLAEDDRYAPPQEVIVLVLEAAKDSERHNAHEGHGRTRNEHTGARAHSDRGHEPEAGGGREPLDGNPRSQDGATGKEPDRRDDRRRDALRVRSSLP